MPEYKVLIVDDSPFMRKVFSDVIDADAAFNVLATASNGKEAVDLAIKLKPDIITMDLEMPHWNGIEALQRIMAIQPTPVIMLSAVTDNGTRDTIKALQCGAVDFIRKPDGAVKLDIRQVGEQLLEKLHIALETMSSGSLRMLPAVEEKAEFVVQPPPASPLEKPESINSVEKALPKPKTDWTSPPSETDKAKKSLEEIQSAFEGVIDKRIPGTGPSSQPFPIGGLPKVKESETKPKPGKEIVQRKELKLSPALANNGISAKKTAQAIPLSRSADAPIVSANFTHLVAVGTSTGGPRALHELLTGIPSDFPAPILVVQHMPPKFTHSLAQRLDNFCSIHVREAVDGEVVETATAYIAPGGKHMSLAKDTTGKYRIRLSEEGPKAGHMPSVDVLFESLIGHQQLKRHAVLMTGMGSDGAKGMKALQTDGASTTIAESEQTCVVYGMPRSAVELGAVSHQLPLQAIAPVLVQKVKTRKS